MRLSYTPGSNRASNVPVEIQTVDGTVEVIVDQVDADGATLWSDRFVIQLPERDAEKAVIDARLPDRPDDAVRVMSANVLYSSPLSEPMPFKRVLDAAKALDRWYRMSEDPSKHLVPLVVSDRAVERLANETAVLVHYDLPKTSKSLFGER